MSVQINGSDGVDSSGKLQSGGDPNDGTAVGAKMLQSGLVQAARSSGSATSAVFMGFTEGTATATSRINANGSASFGGVLTGQSVVESTRFGESVQLGGASDGALVVGGSGANNKVKIGYDGTALFKSGESTNVTAQSTDGNGGFLNFSGLNSSGNTTFSVNHNGTVFVAGGISFGTFSSPVTTKTLDDYEEGTFEPIYTSSDGDFNTVTYHADTGGRYVKIGNYVWCTGCARINAGALDTSNRSNGATLRIGGLPFVNRSRSNGDNSDSPNAVRTPVWSAGASAPNFIALSPNTNTANLFFIGAIGAVASVNTVSQLGTSSMVQFTVTYTSDD